ncbi:hypothetical protein BLNAU_2800 [Blattamonas nauphoetae]|uniref:Uncharacterized protein n=1 Tax=Blattamonas nauphoetae TaxID=2049346 RepID=A0ABQ9YED3_9EUKA|nr:hypothetical protein BLNAU_2800 [Blattamonas nauphoetae]
MARDLINNLKEVRQPVPQELYDAQNDSRGGGGGSGRFGRGRGGRSGSNAEPIGSGFGSSHPPPSWSNPPPSWNNPPPQSHSGYGGQVQSDWGNSSSPFPQQVQSAAPVLSASTPQRWEQPMLNRRDDRRDDRRDGWGDSRQDRRDDWRNDRRDSRRNDHSWGGSRRSRSPSPRRHSPSPRRRSPSPLRDTPGGWGNNSGSFSPDRNRGTKQEPPKDEWINHSYGYPDEPPPLKNEW